MTMVDPLVTVTNSRFYYDDGAEGVATGIAAAGTDPVGLTPDVTYRLRLVVAETAGASVVNADFQWQYYHTEGTATWTDITTTSSVVKAVTSTHITDGNDTTQQVGSGTFITPNLGFTEDGTSGGGSPDYSGNDETETELAFQIVSTDVSATDNINFRVLIKGSPPGGTPHEPSVTVGQARNVTQNPAQGGDLTTCSFTESTATVSKVIKRNVPCTTATIQQKFGGFGTTTVNYTYCDGSDYVTSTGTNPNNAVDDNESTYWNSSSNSIARWSGTNISATGNEVVRVRGRTKLYTTDANGFDRIEFLSGSNDSTVGHGGEWPFPTTSTTIDFPDNEIGDSTPQFSAWYDMNPNQTPGGSDTQVPYERGYLDELGLIAQGSISSTENRIYDIEFEYTTGANETGYMTTATDVDGTWTNEANAVDGSTSTAATFTGASSASDFTADVLRLTVPSNASIDAGKDIYNVCVRMYCDIPASQNIRFRFLDAANNVLHGKTFGWSSYSSDAGGARWGQWFALNVLEGDGSWTNTNVDDIKIEIIALPGSTGTLSIYKAEVAYLYEDFNPQGATVTKTLGRVAAGSTVALAFTDNDATVPIDRSIDLLGHAEQLAWTMPDATVERPQKITGKTARKKQWKALPWSQWWVDGHTGIFGTHDAGTIGNALDEDLVTKYDPVSHSMPVIKGVETLGPQSSATALPAGIKVRWYISGTAGANCAAYAGWRPGLRSEYVGNYQDGMFHLGTITVPTSGEGWTDWQDCHLAYNIGGRSNGAYPYTWNDIQEYFSVGTGAIFLGGNLYVHGIQILVEEAEPANFISGYVDASHGWTDEKGAWTGHANAWDGSESTFAGTVWGSAGTYVADYLDAAGNTLTQGAAEDEVRAVWYRAKLRGQYTGANNLLSGIIFPYHPDYYDYDQDNTKFPVYGGKALLPYLPGSFAAPDDPWNGAMWDFAASNTSFWTPWYKIDFENLHEDWAGARRWKSWEEVQKMGFRLYRAQDPDRVTTLEIGKVEYLVLAEPPNTNRGGGKIKKDRGVNQNRGAGGDLTDMQFAGTQATVSTASVNRNVTCTTEAVSMTESASTVNAERGVTGATEAVSMASTGSVARVRGIVGLTEAITMPATASLNLARGVSSSPETLQLAEVASTVNASRVTSGVTEVLSSTSAGTNVETARGVQSGTEALICSESSSTVNAARNKVSPTEQITMPGTLATISTTANLDVTCTTEAISFTETPASVNGTRIAAATAEITAFVENASTVNTERSVSATTETLALTDNDSTVAFGRIVAATTESISLVEGSSTVDRQRGVNAGTEALSLTESAANVNGKRIAAASAELTALAENTANINRARDTIGVTESVTISENASVVDRQRGVNAGTEAVVMTESLSTVLRGANLDVVCTTEAISFTESAAPINRTLDIAATTEALSVVEQGAVNLQRGVNGLTEALSLTESQADITISANNRDVTCTTEVVSLTESAATVTFPRIVAGATEAITLTEVPAGVNGVRIVGSSVALSALAESGAVVNLSRTVTSLTDQLSMTEALATVSTSTNRIVNAVTEQLSVQESSAANNQTRGVSSSTEVLAFAEQPSSIQVLRNVVATTEQLALAEAGASVLTTRDVIGLTSSLLMTETAAQVFRGANLDVTGTTQAIAFTETAAAVAFPRNVSGLTEQISLVAVPSTLNRPWLVTCTTEELSFTEGLAKIDKTRTGAMPGSIIWVHPETKPVWVSD